MTNKDKRINRTAWTIWALLAILCMLAVSFISCQSESGKLSTLPNEKVVILTVGSGNIKDQPHLYKYKVKRFEKGVVDVIYDPKRFVQGDTIYHRFPN